MAKHWLWAYALLTLSAAACKNEAAPPVRMPLDQLEKAFDQNEVGAMNIYSGKTLEVGAVVVAAILDRDDAVSLNLESIGLLPVNASVVNASRQKAGTLHAGDRVTLRCTGLSEMMSKPVLHDCTIL